MMKIDAKKYPHCAHAHQYARDVVSGKVLVCKWVRLACQRQLDDLERWQGVKGAPYTFDFEAGERIVDWVQSFPHVKGKWARERRLLELEPWQKFIWAVPFGWARTDNGLRRFREVFDLIPRKNAKSTMVAPVGHYMFAADGEEGAEVYAGATTEKQAWEVYGPARLMAKRSPAYTEAFGIDIRAKNMNILDSAAKFEPLIGDPGDGSSPHCAIVDEYHEHQSARLYDTMLTGMGARSQPMMIVITTAGYNLAGPCYDMQLRLQKVLEGVFEDDELFGVIYSVDDDTDWKSEEALLMANPNAGVSVDIEFLRSQQRKAIQSPSKQNAFKTKHLNVWCNASTAWMNMTKWDACADTSLKIDDFDGEGCYFGLDLASKLDVASRAVLFPRYIDGRLHAYAFLRSYLPKQRLWDDDCANRDIYSGWAEDGWLILTPGEAIDQNAIKDDLEADARRFDLCECAFDPFQAAKLVGELLEQGLPMIEVGQTVKNLSDPMKELEAMVVEGRFHHDGNPVFKWMVANVVAHVDAKDNIFPRKERPEYKIDGVVATIMALSRLVLGGGGEENAFYAEVWD
jgi:phage terminase large subunit-like protein